MKKTATFLGAVAGLIGILLSSQVDANPKPKASTEGMRFCKKNESPIIIVNGARVQVCRNNYDLSKGEVKTIIGIVAAANGNPEAEIAKCEADNQAARRKFEADIPLVIEKITELSEGLYRNDQSNLIINETKNGIGRWDSIQEIKSLDGPINAKVKLYFKYSENNSPANIANNGVIKSYKISSRINIKKNKNARYLSRVIYAYNQYKDNSWKDGIEPFPSYSYQSDIGPCNNYAEVDLSRLLMNLEINIYADGNIEVNDVYGLPIGNNEAKLTLQTYVFKKDPYKSIFSNHLNCPDNRLFESRECKIGWYISSAKQAAPLPTSTSQPKIQYSGKGYLGVQTEIRSPQTQYRQKPDGTIKSVKIVGATVTTVSPGSPAAIAGVKVGDIIETVHSRFGTKSGFGYTGTGFLPIDEVVAEIGAGFPIKLDIVRGGQDLSLDIVLGNMPTSRRAEQPQALRLKEIKEAEIRFANEVRAADIQRAQGVKAVATNSVPALPTAEQIAQLGALKTSADRGDANAILQLCKAYYEGKQAPQDYTQAIVWCLPAGEQGNAEAQHFLGKMYSEGLGISKEPRAAISWFRKAADQGFARSQASLGYMYSNGQGVVQDYATAVSWYRKAAEQGNAVAQYNLGGMHDNGWGVAKDPAAAVSWYRKAADQGNANAQYNLGVMYYNGTGVTQDYTAAVSWYRKAAGQGDPGAQYNLGVMYYNGTGVTQDYEIAALWFRNGAEQGDAAAQYYLGFLYQRGAGVAQDSAVAVGWFRKAADQGYEPAKRALQDLGI